VVLATAATVMLKKNNARRQVDPKSKSVLDQAILSARRVKSKEMAPEDKQAIVGRLVEKMEDAWRRDMDALSGRPPAPAMHKLALLPTVEKILRQRSLHEDLLEGHILEMLRNWLAPWPAEDRVGRELPLAKRTLPSLTLRKALFELLRGLPVDPEHLKNSERVKKPARGCARACLSRVGHVALPFFCVFFSCSRCRAATRRGQGWAR